MLRVAGERHREDTEGEDDETHDATPHGGVVQNTRARSPWASSDAPPRWPRILFRRFSGNRHANTIHSTSCSLTPCEVSTNWCSAAAFWLYQKREVNETRFAASVP